MPPHPNLAVPAVVFGSHTDTGKRRGNNEDSTRCGVLAAGSAHEGVLLAVSDGVGGARAGEVASRTAVDDVHTLLAERLKGETPPANRREWIDAAIRATDRRIRAAGLKPGFAGMGATVALLWLEHRSAWWGQAGDSRIYLLRGKTLRQLSHDQSPVGRLRAEHKLTEEQARVHPFRHIIDQSLGGEGAPVVPETGALELSAGDIFLLCSDGLTDGLWDSEIEAELIAASREAAPDEIARRLVARANDASGKDNITAAVARVNRIADAANDGNQCAGGGFTPTPPKI